MLHDYEPIFVLKLPEFVYVLPEVEDINYLALRRLQVGWCIVELSCLNSVHMLDAHHFKLPIYPGVRSESLLVRE